MWIAVLSGKGGTGKTTVAASLAAVIPGCQYVDCDVEEPNGAIFLKPEITATLPVAVPVPQVDAARCSSCGACAVACQFNAIAVINKIVLTFPEICHHCGACSLACPTGVVSETEREIGAIEQDKVGNFRHGRLNIGEPVGIPIIRALKEKASREATVIFDCPPGASCAVVRSLDEVDYCLLVTEPTPFGLHDLKIAVELIRQMDLPAGVIINKSDGSAETIRAYCREAGIPVRLEIPFSTAIAANYSRGILPVAADPKWAGKFTDLASQLAEEVGR